MTTEEMIEELKKWPGKKVMVRNDLENSLDEAEPSLAINHPEVYILRQSWHWPGSRETPVDGEEVVVIY